MASSTFGSGHDSISGVNLVLVGSPVQHIGCAALSDTPSQTAKASPATALNREMFFLFFIGSNLLKLRHLGEETLQSPNRPAPRLRTFRQQLDDARFTQFASDSPCDDPTRFATRSPTYGSYRRSRKATTFFTQKWWTANFFASKGMCLDPLLRKKACCLKGVKTLTPVLPFEDHCRWD